MKKIKYIKPHRVLAILRAVKKKQLNIKVEIDENYIFRKYKKKKKYKIKPDAQDSKELVFDAYKDGLKRFLPSLKREAITNLKEKASKEAIELFGKKKSKELL